MVNKLLLVLFFVAKIRKKFQSAKKKLKKSCFLYFFTFFIKKIWLFEKFVYFTIHVSRAHAVSYKSI